ncbi:hypothetical protein C8J57DRAFT_1246113 [Mycena rebaudengoi]|nr:hypothetical protein C8J57DRAFT_1246113 [Mycena rebaudengoi]
MLIALFTHSSSGTFFANALTSLSFRLVLGANTSSPRTSLWNTTDRDSQTPQAICWTDHSLPDHYLLRRSSLLKFLVQTIVVYGSDTRGCYVLCSPPAHSLNSSPGSIQIRPLGSFCAPNSWGLNPGTPGTARCFHPHAFLRCFPTDFSAIFLCCFLPSGAPYESAGFWKLQVYILAFGCSSCLYDWYSIHISNILIQFCGVPASSSTRFCYTVLTTSFYPNYLRFFDLAWREPSDAFGALPRATRRTRSIINSTLHTPPRACTARSHTREATQLFLRGFRVASPNRGIWDAFQLEQSHPQ